MHSADQSPAVTGPPVGERPTNRGASSGPVKPVALRSDGLVLISLVSLPFTQALTLDVGFPLKIYELTFAASALLRIVSPRSVGQAVDRRLLVWGSAMVVGSAVSLAYAVTLRDHRPSDFGLYRFSPTVDGLLACAYLVLAIAALLLVADLARRRRDDVVTYWLRGALFCAAYAVYVNVNALLRLGFPLLPGTSDQTSTLSGVKIFRAGTFLEGNFLGLYLLASLVLALTVRRLLGALLLTLAILISLSTLNVLLAMVLWVAFVVIDLRRGFIAPKVLLLVLPLVLVLLSLPSSYYQAVLVDKLQDPRSQSAVERRASAAAAVEMFEDHPLTGIGVAQYGLYLPQYRPAFLPHGYLSDRARFIANNVYVQVAAEQGLVGLIPFLGLLWLVARSAARSRSRLLMVGFLSVVVVLNAFPSSTVVYLWAFFGVLIGGAGSPAVPDLAAERYSTDPSARRVPFAGSPRTAGELSS